MDERAVIKGWLTRKASFLKTRFWFWLVEDKLMYAKTSPMFDSNLKCSTVEISSVHQVRRLYSPMSFEIVSHREHFSLTADTQVECDDWVKSLQIAMQQRCSSSWTTQSAHSSSLSEVSPSDGATFSEEQVVTAHEVPEDKVPVATPLTSSKDSATAETASSSPGASKVARECQLLAESERDVTRAMAPAPDQPPAIDADQGSVSMAAHLAAHIAKKKALLHLYEEITTPAQRDGDSATGAGVALRSTSVKSDRSRKTSLSTHDLVVVDDGKVELGSRKKFSITATNDTSSGKRTDVAPRSTFSRGIKGPKGLDHYEEIILEEDGPLGGGLNEAVAAAGSFSGSAAAVEAAAYLAEQPPPTDDAAKYQAGSDGIKEKDDKKAGLHILPPETGDGVSSGAKALYSTVKLQSQLGTAGTCLNVTAAPTWPRWQQHAHVEADTGLRGSDDDGVRPPLLPSPRPVVQIIEATDDTYSRLRENEGESMATAAAVGASAAPTANTPEYAYKIRAFRPQPYSHSVSVLKDYLVRERAFDLRGSAALRLTGSASTRLNGRLGSG